MDANFYRSYLIHTLDGKPASGGREVYCKCKYCRDGKSKKSRHMYISIPMEPDVPSMFDCKLCHAHGIVTAATLREWGCNDIDVGVMVTEHNKHISKKFINSNFEKYIVRNDALTINEASQQKLKYFNDRLGTRLEYRDILQMKIVLNLYDLIQLNRVELTRDPRVVSELNKYFLGFLSFDNAYLNMRRLVDSGIVSQYVDKRYINYNIFGKIDNTHRFYTIPTTVDLTGPDPIKIHLSEGPFDILGIYYNLRHQEPGIYSCITGSNYKRVISNFVSELGIPYVELHIYPDNDEYGTDSVMYNLLDYTSDLDCPFYVHRNVSSGEKDFGVPLERVTETISRLR